VIYKQIIGMMPAFDPLNYFWKEGAFSKLIQATKQSLH